MADHTYSLTSRPAASVGLVTDDSTSSISNLGNSKFYFSQKCCFVYPNHFN